MYSVLRLTVLFTLFVSLFTPVPGSGSIQCGDNIEINNLFSSASYGYFTVSRRAIIFFASFATTKNKIKQKTKQKQKTISWTKLPTYIFIYYNLEVELRIKRAKTGSWECLFSEWSKHNPSNDYFHNTDLKKKTVVVYFSVGLWFMTLSKNCFS